MASNYTNLLFRDYEKVCKKLDDVLSILKEEKKEKKELNNTIKEMNKTIEKL